MSELETYLEKLNKTSTVGDSNVLSVIGKETSENVNSNILAWLLNPGGSHGLGSAFLEKFLAYINAPYSPNDLHVNVKREENMNESDRLDIMIYSEQFGVAIENKVFTGEGYNQLSRYDEFLENLGYEDNLLRVFLTLDGKKPVTSVKWTAMSHKEIVEIIRSLDNLGDINRKSLDLINDYIETIEVNSMGAEDNKIIEELIKKYPTAAKKIHDFYEKIDFDSDFANVIKDSYGSRFTKCDWRKSGSDQFDLSTETIDRFNKKNKKNNIVFNINLANVEKYGGLTLYVKGSDCDIKQSVISAFRNEYPSDFKSKVIDWHPVFKINLYSSKHEYVQDKEAGYLKALDAVRELVENHLENIDEIVKNLAQD